MLFGWLHFPDWITIGGEAQGALQWHFFAWLTGLKETIVQLRRSTLLQLGMREMTYGWNIEMQMRAASSGLRILEIPVPYRRRTGGVSKVAGSLTGTLRAGSRIVATFVRVYLAP